MARKEQRLPTGQADVKGEADRRHRSRSHPAHASVWGPDSRTVAWSWGGGVCEGQEGWVLEAEQELGQQCLGHGGEQPRMESQRGKGLL